jgi:iron complex outermembrane recepter protein
MKILALALLFSAVLQNVFGQLPANPANDSLKTDTQRLRQVIVTAVKPLYQQQTTGITVNVEGSLLTKGSSVLEVLERSPGVVIDRRNNDISLNGKEGVMVMIDGRLMRMPTAQVAVMLNGMSADDVSSIELLTTPPASADAQGSAGLINIVLKKTRKKGTSGSYSFTGGYGKGEKATASGNLTHNSEKIDLSGSYTFSHDVSYSDMFITSSEDMPILGGKMNSLFWNTAKPVQNSHDARASIRFRPDPLTTIEDNISYTSNYSNTLSLTQADYNILPDSLLQFDGHIQNKNRWGNLGNSLYLDRQLGKKDRVSLGLDYISYKNDNPTDIQSSFHDKDGNRAGTNNDTLFSPHQMGFANTHIQVGVGKIDYVRQPTKNIKLESGIKGAYTDVTSLSGIQSLVNGVWTGRSETVNEIDMHEFIGAAYVSASAQTSPSFSLVIGARYEYAHTQMDNERSKETTVDRIGGMLFPNFSLSKKFGDRSALQFSYTRRIDRPSYNDLASYVSYSDPSAVFTGNPLLRSTITNNLKLGYSYGKYSFSLLLSRDDYPIVRAQLTKSPTGDILYVSPQNLTYLENLNLQANLPVKINDWWSMNYSITGGPRRFRLDYTVQPAEKTYFGYSLNFSQMFRLQAGWSAELSGWYNSVWYSGTVRGDGFGTVNAGIKKELAGNRGIFQLSVSDLFRTMNINSYFGAVTAEVFDIKTHVNYNAESEKFPIIKLSYSRSFGSGSSDTREQRNAGSGAERDRIRKE